MKTRWLVLMSRSSRDSVTAGLGNSRYQSAARSGRAAARQRGNHGYPRGHGHSSGFRSDRILAYAAHTRDPPGLDLLCCQVVRK
jgi:ribosomal protein L27